MEMKEEIIGLSDEEDDSQNIVMQEMQESTLDQDK